VNSNEQSSNFMSTSKQVDEYTEQTSSTPSRLSFKRSKYEQSNEKELKTSRANPVEFDWRSLLAHKMANTNRQVENAQQTTQSSLVAANSSFKPTKSILKLFKLSNVRLEPSEHSIENKSKLFYLYGKQRLLLDDSNQPKQSSDLRKSHSSNKFKYLTSTNSLILLSKLAPVVGWTSSSASTSKQHVVSYSTNEFTYKNNNEFYSIFVSMFTAALFLFFIMWRWLRMKSDLRKALQEQLLLEQQGFNRTTTTTTTTSSSASSSRLTPTTPLSPALIYNSSSQSNRWHVDSLYQSINRDTTNRFDNNHFDFNFDLASWLEQHANTNNRANQDNHGRTMDASKYYLQQLRTQRRLNQMGHSSNNSNYYTFNQSQANTASSPYADHILLPSHACSFSSSLSSSLNNYDISYHQQHNHRNIELPPSYESVMSKSSSLPSYSHLVESKHLNEDKNSIKSNRSNNNNNNNCNNEEK